MKHIKLFNESTENIYKALYVTPILVDKTGSVLMAYYPIDIQKKIRMICDLINEKYKDKIIVEMNKDPITGLIIKDGDIKEIADKIYDLYQGLEYGCRIVYGEGEVITFTKNINTCWGELLVRIGRHMDTLKNKTGVYKA